ncbi:MAG: ABC transporter ATP-binding protein [Thermoprotei archaeon]
MSYGVVIDVKGLVKYYGNVIALDGVSFQVRSGEIYGLLGPNGAGKTTTLKIVSGLLRPTSGSVRVLGLDPVSDPVSVKRLIGYVPENPMLYDSLTPREFFEFVLSVRHLRDNAVIERLSKLVEAFNLVDYMNQPIASLSLGTRQKVAVVAGFVHNPPLLILDEPLNGLDARSSRIVKDLLNLHVSNGGSVLFSTHIMEVAEHICHRVGIIHKGKIVAEGTVNELREKLHEAGASLEEIFLKVTEQDEAIAEIVKALKEAFNK